MTIIDNLGSSCMRSAGFCTILRDENVKLKV